MILTLVMVYLVSTIVTFLVSYLVWFSYENYKKTNENNNDEEVLDVYEMRKNEQDIRKREEELKIKASHKRPIEPRSK